MESLYSAPGVSDNLPYMNLLERLRAGLVPHSNSRFWLEMVCMAAYFVAFFVVTAKLPIRHLSVVQSSAVWAGFLCFIALVTAMATDYTRRPLTMRLQIVIGGMLLYALVLQPAHAWLGRYMAAEAPDAAMARAIGVSMNHVAGTLLIAFSIKTSRLVAKDPDLPLKDDPAALPPPIGDTFFRT